MDSRDNVRERFEALAQQTEPFQPQTRRVARQRWGCLPWRVATVLALGLVLGPPPRAPAAPFACGAGEVDCLITAINTANANGEDNTITLEAGTYTLTTPDNDTDGINGLPSVTSTLTIRGAGDAATVLDGNGVGRLIHVAATGTLTLEQLTLQGGILNARGGRLALFGGGIFNKGTLTLFQSTLARNVVIGPRIFLTTFDAAGGGLYNNGGTVRIIGSTVTDNVVGAEDRGDVAGGGVYTNGGVVTILNSTLARNTAGAKFSGLGGGLYNNGGTVHITNSTLTRNTTLSEVPLGGGLFNNSNSGGTVALLNTILTLNTTSLGSGPNCAGSITSLGTNLLGDLTDCTLTLLDTDLTGDPGLGPFTDDGIPGHGHFPLLPGSPAIDAGNNTACPATDQLGRPRVGRCDIGAIEFEGALPNVNDLVTFTPLPSSFTTTADPAGCPAGFAGTFRFAARLMAQASSPALTDLRVQVQTLTHGNLLQNADGGPAGVGATLTVPQAEGFADGLLSPEEAVDVPFVVCVQERSPFRFFVDVLGIASDGGQEPRADNVR